LNEDPEFSGKAKELIPDEGKDVYYRYMNF